MSERSPVAMTSSGAVLESTTTLSLDDKMMAPCSEGDCGDGGDPPHQLNDHLLRTVAISIQTGCVLITFLLVFLVFRYRKYKAISGSAWVLLELILLGALLLYSMVMLRYFESPAELCLLEPWLRELGFTCCYGTIVLKIYRLLVEFRTRKAHRWVVREKDLLKYWAVMVACVVVYLASGTISTIQHTEHSLVWNGWSGALQQQEATHPSWSTTAGATTGNQTRPVLLFPKSIKGEGAGGIRVRGDGVRTTWGSNASSILMQKAKVLRRESEANETLLTTLLGQDNHNSTSTSDDLLAVDPSTNATRCYHSFSLGNNLLYVRFPGHSGVHFTVCRQLWWHYVNMAAEFLFLLTGLYISWSARNAASHHGEKLCLFLGIFVEFCASTAYTVLSRLNWIREHPDHLFMLEFSRSQLATTLVLLIIFGPKMFFIFRQASNRDIKRMEHQTSQIENATTELLLSDRVQIPMDSQIFKKSETVADGTAGPAASFNGEVDLGNLDLSEMDPEVIREELKRVYTQLHVLKMKTLRKDNPHISKRRGGRKPPHRRFSLQRSRVLRDKSKRSTRKSDGTEEGGVEESVNSVDHPTSAPQPTQSAAPELPVMIEVAEIEPLPTKVLDTKF